MTEADTVIVMNRPSLEKYERYVKKGGLLIINSTLTDQKAARNDIEVLYVPANDLAEQAGSVKAANMVVLGAYLHKTNVVESRSIIAALEKIMGEKKAKLIPLNEKALELGAECAK